MSDTPRTDAMIIFPGSGIVMVRPEFAQQLERELAEARAEIERLRKDAERYRWLRDDELAFGVYPETGPDDYQWMSACGEELDELIDAAMKEQSSGPGSGV